MKTADDYASWIVANQNKKGTREFQVVSQAYEQAKQEEAQQGERGAAESPYTLRQAIGSAPFTLLPSLYRNIIEPIVERPKETLRAGAGLLTEAVLRPGPSPETAKTIREDYSQAYGTPQNFLRTVAEDPARPLLDLSLLGTGTAGLMRAGARSIPRTSGGRVKARGLLEQGSEKVLAASEALDPLAVTSRGLEAAGTAVAAPLAGITTGTGTRAMQETFRAGRAGGESAEAYLSQRRGGDPQEVIGPAKAALENIRAQRNQQYRSGMVNVKGDKTVLDFGKVDQTLADIRDRGFFKGKEIDRSAADTWRKIDELVQEWKTSNPADFHTPEGLDALKKSIGDIRDNLQFGTPARNVANNVYSAVRQQITGQAPSYAKVMKDYEDASALINEIEGTLSLGKKASVDQSLRKLQSILRNNVYTGYGSRMALGEELARQGAPNLFPQLAGMATEPIAPRGLVGQGTAAAMIMSVLGGAGLPALAPLALTSPRAMGSVAFGAGRLAGAIDRPGAALRGVAGAITPQVFQRQMQRYGARLAQQRPEYAMLIDRAQREMQMGRLDPLIMRQLAVQFGRLEQDEQR
jgi:hypothetical protein